MPKENPCTGCDGRCCRLTVELSIYDVGRISGFLDEIKEGKNIDFLSILPARDEQFGFMTGEGRVRFILNRKPDGSCIFFNNGNGLHCSVEKAKPSICIAYPLEIRKGQVAMRKDNKCPLANKARWFPGETEANIINGCDWEWDRYKEMISDWNARFGGKETAEQFGIFAAGEIEVINRPLGRISRSLRRWVGSAIPKI